MVHSTVFTRREAMTSPRQYARPLTDALAKNAVSVWIDEAEIELGESVIDAVNSGLRLAQYVIVLVTDSFLAQGWTRKELNAAFMREVAGRDTVVLPILAIEPTRWAEEFPLVADKLYIRWSLGVEEIAGTVAKRFARQPGEDWVHEHPQKYRGPVWVRCTLPGADPNTTVRLTLRWGPYIRKIDVPISEGHPVSLVHHKTEYDQVPLHVNCDPPAIVTYGHGPAPDALPHCLNIDEGWTRSLGADIGRVMPPNTGELPKERDLLVEQLAPEEPPEGRTVAGPAEGPV
jgi:hypothetical protein